jgi:hypothetical protein
MNRFIRVVAMCAAVGLAVYSESVPAMFIAIIGSALYIQLHTIEVKLNKLLDHHRIFVSRTDIEDG